MFHYKKTESFQPEQDKVKVDQYWIEKNRQFCILMRQKYFDGSITDCRIVMMIHELCVTFAFLGRWRTVWVLEFNQACRKFAAELKEWFKLVQKPTSFELWEQKNKKTTQGSLNEEIVSKAI